jgi:FkbM family methyltransferase
MKHYFSSGFFIDVGANDGINRNKTNALQTNGWEGVCIEANPLIFPKLVKNRSCATVVCVNECLVSGKNSGKKVKYLVSDTSSLSSGIIPDDDFESRDAFRWNEKTRIDDYCRRTKLEYKTVETDTKSLHEVLEKVGCPKVVEYAKFDIEGAEEEVLSDFCFEEYCFLFLVIEHATEKLYKKLCDNNFMYAGREGHDDYFVNKKNPYTSRYVEKPFKYSGGHKR